MEAGIVAVVRVNADGCVYLGQRGRSGGLTSSGLPVHRRPRGQWESKHLEPGRRGRRRNRPSDQAGGSGSGRFAEFACHARGANSSFEIQDAFPPLND